VRATKLLIADHAPTRRGIKIALGDLVEVCAEAGSAEEALELARRTQPDVCIVGLEISGGGIDTVQAICTVAPEAKVIVMAAAADPRDLIGVIRGGAIGYVPGSIDATALGRVVLAAAEGEAAIPRSLVIELARELQGAGARDDRLTPRATQVLALLREGQSTAEIAETLRISPVTVRRHISILRQRTGTETRTALSLADLPRGVAAADSAS
jgi:DNA-binding NarL/FixJ family response regulator